MTYKTEYQHLKCKIESCYRRIYCREYCSKHYKSLNISKIPLEKNNSGWNHNGYVRLVIDGKEIPEHRYVMQKHLSRELLPSENVHHKNGNRSDNRIENLEIWSHHQPAGQRIEDKIQYAKEILQQYGLDHDYCW